MQTNAVNTESQLLRSGSCGDQMDEWQLAGMQAALSNIVRGRDVGTGRFSPGFNITGSHTTITFKPRAVRVGHEPAEEDFDWAIAITDEIGADVDEHHAGVVWDGVARALSAIQHGRFSIGGEWLQRPPNGRSGHGLDE